MNLECHACGRRFRSMMAEAQHRHNFPAMCRRNKQFARWSHHANIESMKAAWDARPVGGLVVVVWIASGNPHKALYVKLDDRVTNARVRRGRCLAGSTAIIDGKLHADDGTHTYALADEFFESKLRLDMPTAAQEDAFVMLLQHGKWQRAFERVGFVPDLKASDHLTGSR